MNKRLLIIVSLIILVLALAGAILIWTKDQEGQAPSPNTSTETPRTEFPVPAPMISPAPAATANPTSSTRTSENSTSILPTPDATTPNPFLVKLSAAPIAGAALIPRASSTTPARIIYLEENTGHLFQVALNGQNNRQLTRSSLPGVARVWWGKSRAALTLIAQYLDSQEKLSTFRGVYRLDAATSTEPTELVGGLLPDVSAGAITVSPSRDRFFYLLDVGTGVNGIITDLTSGRAKTIFTSPLKSWQVSWPNATIIALTQRAAADLPGTLYFLNPDNGALTRALGDKVGLTTLVSPRGTEILYTQNLGELKLYSTRDGSTKNLTLVTLPEKCLWASDSTTIYCAVPNLPAPSRYPDNWWSGEAAFSDNFWRINVSTGESKIVGSSANNHLDVMNLILDEAGQRLIFTDRWSGILWSLDLR